MLSLITIFKIETSMEKSNYNKYDIWSEVHYREKGERRNESLRKRLIGVVSDEKWKTGVKARVN